MSKILELAYEYSRHCVIAGVICDNKASAALVAEVEKEMKYIRELEDAVTPELVALRAELEAERALIAAYMVLLDEVTAERNAARKDAARYRFIETHPDYGACIWDKDDEGFFTWYHVTAAQIDAAIVATK